MFGNLVSGIAHAKSLDAILMRKMTFRQVHLHFAEGNLEAAVEGCEVLICPPETA